MKQMSRQEYRDSAGDYQADEQAGVARLRWRVSADEQAGVARLSWRVSADEQAGVARVRWRLSGRYVRMCREAQVAMKIVIKSCDLQ